MAYGLLKGTSSVASYEDDDDKYTDADLFALLCRDGMGGFGGITWDVYCHTPDHVIRDSYFAEFDDDHRLVTYRQRWRALRDGNAETGRPQLAGRELPSREQLNIPAEAWQANPMIARTPFGQGYLLMFWQCWRRRQAEGVLDENGEPLSDVYILERWKKKVGTRASSKHGQQQSKSESNRQRGSTSASRQQTRANRKPTR